MTMFDTRADARKKAKTKGDPELARMELARNDRLKSARDAVFTPAWQTLADNFLPNLSDINTEKTEGTSGWSDQIYDTTAIEAARTCTSGQGNWSTPATEPWFGWRPPKFLNMEEDDDGATWSAECSEIALDELARGPYYRISGDQYKSRTVFGTGLIFLEEGKATTINARTSKIGTYCIENNDEDIVDTVYREFELTARQAAQMFGVDNLGEKVKKAFDSDEGKNMDKKFKFLHAVHPREDMDRQPGKIDPENKAVASIYVSFDDKICVKISGYDEMPYSVTRFDSWGTGTPWGYSPAFETLPNVRQLNYMVRFSDGQNELRANPRILEPVNTRGQTDLRPGGRTTYDPSLPGGGKPEEWMTLADVTGTEKAIILKQDAVNRMFYVDVFKALQQIKYKATAYEISQRLGENLQQLSPMFMRLIAEKTGPDLKRVFGLLFRAGKFPPPPRSMYIPVAGTRNGMRLVMPEVTYTSRLALALKAMQNRATMDTMQFVSEFAANTQKPELLDNWDLDSMIRTYAINQGMSARFERPMKQVIQLRQARANKLAEERAMAMAEQAASAAGKLGKAPAGIQESISEQIPQGAAA